MSNKKSENKTKKKGSEKKNTKKNNTETKKKENKRVKLNKKMPKTKLKPGLQKKCEKDISCMYDKDTFKPTIKEIYPNPEQFGFTIDIPNETPLKKKNFKTKCKGFKKSLIYEEPEINKKYFGFLLPKLNRSLYVGKQTNHNCYETKKKKKRKNVPLGKLCFKDDECESKNCSSIKFLKLPGTCRLPKNTNKIVKGNKCNYDLDCKKNLECVNKKCVEKPKSVKSTIERNKEKKKSKGSLKNKISSYASRISDYSPMSKKRYKKTSNGIKSVTPTINDNDSDSDDDNNEEDNISNSDLGSIIEDNDFFANKEGKMTKVNCLKDKDCKKYDSDSYCYKNKCLNIHKRCKTSMIKKCLKKISEDDRKYCCDNKSRCIEHINKNGIINEICINKNKLETSNIGEYCKVNNDCKSGNCVNKICRKKMSKNMKGLKRVASCVTNIDCVKDKYGNKDMVCNKDNICENLKKVKRNKLDIFDECISDNQCKSGKCGELKNERKPLSYSSTIKDNYVCIDSGEKMITKLNEIKKQKIEEKKMINKKIITNISKLKKILQNNYFFIHSDIHNNSMVIIKDNSNIFLGKICKEVFLDKNGEKKTAIIILYFEKNTNINNFSEDYKNLRVLSTSKISSIYEYFKTKNPSKTSLINNYEDLSVNLNNNFIFEYMCYKLFKRRNVIFSNELPFIDSRDGYYNYINKNINFDIEKPKNILGIKDKNNGEFEILSIPFRLYNNKIISVYIKSNGGISEIKNVISEIETKEYVNLDDSVKIFFEKKSFIDYLKINNNIRINRRYKHIYSMYNNKKNINFNNITDLSIFSELV